MSFRNVPVLLVVKHLNTWLPVGTRILKGKCARKLPRCLDSSKAWLHATSRGNSIFGTENNVQDMINADLPDCGHPIESWYYDVNKFGKVTVRSPMSIHLQPLNPQKHPDMNKMFLNIVYVGNEKLNGIELDHLAKQYIVNVDLEFNEIEEISVNIKYKADRILPTVCHLQIPIKYDVEVSCKKEGEASLEKLESSNISVRTQDGDCHLRSVKSGNIEVKTGGGSVLSHTHLQGNLSIRCSGDGDINAGRLQGQTVYCESERGDIIVKSIYADTSSFSTQSGNIHLGSCHGDSDVTIQDGNLIVDTLDGNLRGHVKVGDNSVFMAREGELNLTCDEGDILVRVPTSLQSSVCLVGSRIEDGEVKIHDRQETCIENLSTVTGRLGTSNAGSSQIETGIPGTSDSSQIDVATSDGTIKLQYYNWISSLKLNKKTA